jgi:molybdopterin molybdotransferase
MISVEEALEKILHKVCILGMEEKRLLDCIGQVIAEDIYAPFDLPNYDNSVMDGYAVRAADIKGASKDNPVALNITGKIIAGMVSDLRVNHGEAVMIMTGSMIPDGADVVIPFESTDTPEKSSLDEQKGVKIYQELVSGTFIRKAGLDMREGVLSIKKGKLIGSSEIGFLASIGREKIKVTRRPVVAVLATGDELVNFGENLTRGKIYNSNSFALSAQVIEFGGIPKILGVARDNLDKLTAIFKEEADYDLLITSGGVSAGHYDFVRNALESAGTLEFWQVRMKPGRPLTFGMIGEEKKKPHLGLPGNPVSCMITLEMFGRPVIFKMMGRTDYKRPAVSAIIEDEIENTDGRRIFARVIVENRENQYYARLTGSQDSAIMSSMLKANGLAVVSEDSEFIRKGDKVQVMLLN